MTLSPTYLRPFLLGFCLWAVFASVASAQDTTLFFSNETLFTLTQESIPPNDSGGRWIPTTLLLKSNSAWPVHVYGFPLRNNPLRFCAPLFDCRPADSAWLVADSALLLNGNTGDPIHVFGTPWKYKDSLTALSSPQIVIFEYAIPPHGTVRVPYFFQAIGPFGSSVRDTVNITGLFSGSLGRWHEGPYWFSDSIGGSSNKVLRRTPARLDDDWPPIYAIAPWSAPYVPSMKSPFSNKLSPVVVGQYSPWYFGFTDTLAAYEDTRASFKIVGEYSDRFVPPADTLIVRTCRSAFPNIQCIFNGAPKSVVHDTLISTFSDPEGTVVTRTPIEAYTVARNGYQVKTAPYNTMKAPFLGSVSNTFVISNLSEFPIQLKNFSMQNYSTQRSFQIVSAPNVIAAHGSGTVVIALVDNDLLGDTQDPRRSATITGTVVPYQTDMTFLDSSLTINVDGLIDVYCPVASHYFFTPPKIQHGVHPMGIVFNSDNITTPYSTGKSFLTVYGNDDPVSEYFYVPYYDDPHFQLSIQNFDGIGSAILPAMIPPDTQVLVPSTNFIQVLTVFTGDDKHNYLTKLHWPRANDTVTMDVLALGANAPPYDGVAMREMSGGFSLWPNPVSSTLHISAYEPAARIVIYDLLGRQVHSNELVPNTSIDVSSLPSGVYSVVLNFKSGATSVERLSITR